MTSEIQRKISQFSDFIGCIDNDRTEDSVKMFTKMGMKKSDWVFVTILLFAQTQKERIAKRDKSYNP